MSQLETKSEAPILKNMTGLYKLFYNYLKLFPKKDQYVLGRHCEQYLLNFLELIVYAAGLPREQKLKVLEQANRKFDIVKILFRLARELEMLDNKKYLSLQGNAQEIGRMLGGWIRSLK